MAAALMFHDVHGSNVEISHKNSTATRINKEDNSNGILFSSRALGDGECLEVQLDALSSSIHGRGLEIGVTDIDPATLRSSQLPRTATELRGGRTMMLSGCSVAYNGKEIRRVKHNTYDTQEGDTVCVQLVDGSVQILMSGECVLRLNATKWQHVYGVVDLYGKAEAVTITGMAEDDETEEVSSTAVGLDADILSTLEEAKREMTSLVAILPRSNKEDRAAALVSANILLKCSGNLRIKAPHKQAGDFLAQFHGGHKIVAYTNKLKDWGLEDELNDELLWALYKVCYNFAAYSQELEKQLGQTGLLATCIEDLKDIHEKHQDAYHQNKEVKGRVVTYLGVLHNCAQVEENCVILRKHRLVEVAQLFTEANDQTRSISTIAAMTIAYVMEENEASMARLKQDTMLSIVELLKQSIQEETLTADGWHAYALCNGLAKLAMDDVNLINAVKFGGLKLFAMLLACAGDDQDRLAALEALDAHIAPTTSKMISDGADILENLLGAKQSGISAVMEKASGIYERLAEIIKEAEEMPSDTGGFVQRHVTGREDHMGHLAMAPTPSSSCSYHDLCTQFFHSLGLDPGFFNPAFDMCYCRSCHRERKDEDYYQRGDPPKLYGLPLGWCRFALLLPPRARSLHVAKKWHRAYHGTRHKFLPKILEVGELAIPGRAIVGGLRVRELPGHFCEGYKPDGFDTKNIFLSPSIRYSGDDAYAAPVKWRFKSKHYSTKVAFQVFISPGSYNVGAETIGARKQLDPKFPNSEIEWYTNQQGSTILYGLLVKVNES